jgi:hypothetical protein
MRQWSFVKSLFGKEAAMTTHRGQMSENGKAIAVCLLFPIFWPLLPTLLVCMAVEAARRKLDGPLWRLSCWRRGTCPGCNWPKAECCCDKLDQKNI